MNSRRILGSLTLVLVLGLAAACSDDAKKSANTAADGGAISKADFLTEGNSLCASFNADVQAASANVASEAEQIAVLTEVIVPGLRETLDGIEALGYPVGDEAFVQGLIDDTRDALDTVEADPAGALNSGVDPFGEINAQLVEYGLTVCGQG